MSIQTRFETTQGGKVIKKQICVKNWFRRSVGSPELSVGGEPECCAAKNYGRSAVSVPSCFTLHLNHMEMCSALLLMRQTFLWTMNRRLFPPPFSLKNKTKVLSVFQFFLSFNTTFLDFSLNSQLCGIITFCSV